MRVLLVYPQFPDTFWSFKYALPFVRKTAALPPLGLLTVAALLPDGWEPRLVDTNVRSLEDGDLAWADYLFIGGMAVQRTSAQAIIERAREHGVPVVAGGPLFTSGHDVEDFPTVDHFVLDEAEATLPPFLADLERGCPERVYRAGAYPDVTQSPTPRWDLLDLSAYHSMSVQFSRGCPYDCEFCNVTALFGRAPRVKDAGQVVRELDALCELGWSGQVFFADDNLIGHRKCVRTELLPALVEWRRSRRDVSFFTQASINLADDPELVALMVEAGFDTVFVGIETPDEAALAEANKKHNTARDLIDDVKRLQRAGLQVQGGFIVGFDSDEPSIFQRQIDFIQQSGIVTAMVGLLQAPAGTRLFERLKQEGRLLGRISGDNTDGTTNIIPAMNAETLREGYRAILRHIYSPKPYYRRVRTFLSEYRLPEVRAPLTLERVRAFLRSIYHLGIRERGRRHYWSLLLVTLLRRPRLVPLAVTLAICGHHFRKVSELHVL